MARVRRPTSQDPVERASDQIGVRPRPHGISSQLLRGHVAQRSRDIFEDLWRTDTVNAQARLSLAISYIHLGDVSGYPEQPNLGRQQDARDYYRRSLAFIEHVYRTDSTNTRTRFLRDLVRERLARLGGA